METRLIGTYTEIYRTWGGSFITEAYPTNFHRFYNRKVLAGGESVADYKEVSAPMREILERADGAWERPTDELIAEGTHCGMVWNEGTGFFELNGLIDLTAAQVRNILPYRGQVEKRLGYPTNESSLMCGIKARTLPAINVVRSGGMTSLSKCFSDAALEVVVFKCNYNDWSPYMTGFSNVASAFERCNYLHTVKGLVVDLTSKLGTTFSSCSNLKNLEIININQDLNLQWSPKLTVESIEFLIEWRYESGKFKYQTGEMNTITVTLHPTAFARLTEELIAKGADKQIQFATTS